MTRRVVVVGDVVLDRDVEGTTGRIAPDAPVPVLDVERVDERPGGAGLAARLAIGPDVDVLLVAPFAEDDAGRRLTGLLERHVELLPLSHEGPTRTKCRVRSAGQSLLRIDEGGLGTPAGVPRHAVAEALAGADVVLVSDYGAGVTRDPLLRDLLAAAARTTPIVWDPHPRGGEPVPGVTLATPSLAEARRSVPGDDPPEVLAAILRERWSARGVCVTVGAEGAYATLPGGEPILVPAPAVVAGDPCGAGDRFAAAAAVALACGAVPSQAVVIAVAEASAWLDAGGMAGVTAGGTPAWTCVRPGTGTDELAPVRAQGGRLVATGGCFDVLHVGHVACLQAARGAGDTLVVLLNSDASVRRLKGAGRPVVPQDERARVLRALECVDAVEVFDEDDPCAALQRLRPDVWVKGGDYGGLPMPEADLVRGWGGRVLLLPYVDGRSSTGILSEIEHLEV